MFSKGFFFRVFKSQDCVVRVKQIAKLMKFVFNMFEIIVAKEENADSPFFTMVINPFLHRDSFDASTTNSL